MRLILIKFHFIVPRVYLALFLVRENLISQHFHNTLDLSCGGFKDNFSLFYFILTYDADTSACCKNAMRFFCARRRTLLALSNVLTPNSH